MIHLFYFPNSVTNHIKKPASQRHQDNKYFEREVRQRETLTPKRLGSHFLVYILNRISLVFNKLMRDSLGYVTI
jgi:hypothetical protein